MQEVEANVNQSLPELAELNQTVVEIERDFYNTPMVRKLMQLFPRNLTYPEVSAYAPATLCPVLA
eukprot:1034675-Rhodomonas_salina.3